MCREYLPVLGVLASFLSKLSKKDVTTQQLYPTFTSGNCQTLLPDPAASPTLSQPRLGHAARLHNGRSLVDSGRIEVGMPA